MLDWLTWESVNSFADSELTWANFKSIWNSAFITSVAGALAGAFFGARAAQQIAERSKTRDLQLSQLRQTHSALMTSFVICNAALGFKTQHLKSLYATFTSARAEFEVFIARMDAGQIQPDEVFPMRADLVTLQVPPMPVGSLFTQVNERLSVSRRPLALTAAITGAVESLVAAVKRRDEIVQKFRDADVGPRSHIDPFVYFGVPRNGREDRVYADTMESISRLCDDTIYFSALLCDDLVAHGNSILSLADRVVKEEIPSVGTVDFSESRAKGDIPTDAGYASWLAAFPIKAPASPSSGDSDQG